MLPDDIDLFLLGEITANRTLDWLMDRIFNEDDPESAREALKRIANQFSSEIPQSLEALVYYRGMRAALNEDDFRWGALGPLSPNERKNYRKERLTQYWRHLELFELEIGIARKLRRSSLALRRNWSLLEKDFAEDCSVWRQQVSLRLAGALYQLGTPGALDLCDSAVFQMFRLVYLRPSPAA